MATTTGYAYISDFIKANGGTHFFYVPVIFPDAIKYMVRNGVQPMCIHSEKAAVYMADGYARVSGLPGFCGCQAIGGSNLAAGMREPLMAMSPVIGMTGGPSPDDQHRARYQDVDDLPTFASLTKWSGVVDRAYRLPDVLDQAYRRAMTGRKGPVHMLLPGFFGAMTSDEFEAAAPDDSSHKRTLATRFVAAPDQVAAAAQAISQAQRPVLIAGSGVTASGGGDSFVRYAEAMNIPFALATGAKTIAVDNHPLLVGVVGDYSRESANVAVSEADLVVYVGSNTGSMITRNWTVPPTSTPVIQIDFDATHVGRNYPNTTPVIGDADLTMKALLATGHAAPQTGPWIERINALKDEWERHYGVFESSDALPMRPERLCKEVSEQLPDNGILVVDTGHAGGWLARHIRIRNTNQMVIRAAGSLGWSYPASLGAKAAAPDRPVICFSGDGGMLYHITEIETAVRYNLPTVTVINNNVSLNQEKFIWDASELDDHNWKFHDVDYVKVASGLGAWATRVDNPADVGDAIREALATGRPAVIDARTDLNVAVPLSWGPGKGSPYQGVDG